MVGHVERLLGLGHTVQGQIGHAHVHIGDDQTADAFLTDLQFLLGHLQVVPIVLYCIEQMTQIGIGAAEHVGVAVVAVVGIAQRLEEVLEGPWRVLQVAIDAASVIVHLLLVAHVALLLEIVNELPDHQV